MLYMSLIGPLSLFPLTLKSWQSLLRTTAQFKSQLPGVPAGVLPAKPWDLHLPRGEKKVPIMT